MWAPIFTFIISLVGPLLAKILAGLGIALVAYTGASLVVTELRDYVMGTFNGLPVDLLGILYLLGLDEGVKILFAAYAVKITLQTSMGAFKRISMGGS